MATVSRVEVKWSGPGIVGPALSVFHTVGLGGDLAVELRALYQAIRDLIPTGVTVAVSGEGETYDSATGAFTGVWSMTTPPAAVTGNSPGGFAAGAGGRFVWTTDGVTNSRRVRGSTFVVPLGNGVWNTSGGISSASTAAAAAAAFVTATSGEFVIWTRPVGGAGGKTSLVTAGTFPATATSLRSRRT